MENTMELYVRVHFYMYSFIFNHIYKGLDYNEAVFIQFLSIF